MSVRLNRHLSDNKGLTFIELIIVMSIILILASAIMPLGQMSAKRAAELELKNNLRIIRVAIDEYKKAYDAKRIENLIDKSWNVPCRFQWCTRRTLRRSLCFM